MKAYCGTTLFSLITQHGIVVGADSLAAARDGHIEYMTKLRAVSTNAVIACEGTGRLSKDKGGIASYNAEEWMREVELNLPAEADAQFIANYIEKKHPFLDMFKIEQQAFGLLHNQDRKGYLAEFLVASISGTLFSLITVKVSIDESQWSVVFKPTTHYHGEPPIRSFVRHRAGRAGEIDKALRQEGDAYHYMLSGTRGAFDRLIKGQVVSLDELRDTVRCALKLEAKANPQYVGPPFVIATLQPIKPIEVITCA